MGVVGVHTLRKRQSSLVLPISIDPGDCGHAAPNDVAARVPFQQSPAVGSSTGARQRRSAVGGAAYGMPKNCETPSPKAPATGPHSVVAVGLLAVADAQATARTAQALECIRRRSRKPFWHRTAPRIIPYYVRFLWLVSAVPNLRSEPCAISTNLFGAISTIILGAISTTITWCHQHRPTDFAFSRAPSTTADNIRHKHTNNPLRWPNLDGEQPGNRRGSCASGRPGCTLLATAAAGDGIDFATPTGAMSHKIGCSAEECDVFQRRSAIGAPRCILGVYE